ncbi:MAG: CAP domain-containing protein [Chitinophagales bacterium]|nr:CAP domain-containing protein [Chitinophagales bacterium]
MRKSKWLIVFLLFSFTPIKDGEKWLSDVPGFSTNNYYTAQVYGEHTWQSFEQLSDAKQVVNPAQLDYHLLNAAVFFATNRQRDKSRKPLFRFSSLLRNAAAVHTHQMISKKFFDHVNRKTPALSTMEKRLALFGITNVASAENCDYTYIDVDGSTTYWQLALEIVEDFYKSSGHKKNMLNKTYTHLGCTAEFEPKSDGNYHYVKVTQNFAAL